MSATTSPTPPLPEEITFAFDPKRLPEQVRRDLEANAQINRQSPVQRLAFLLQQKLGDAFTVKAA